MSVDRKRKHCPHCDEFVAVSTFYAHRDLYFREGMWHKAEESSSDEDLVMHSVMAATAASQSVPIPFNSSTDETTTGFSGKIASSNIA